MVSNAVRKGITQARFNEKQVNTLLFELLIISIAIGLYFTSWVAFGGTLAVLMTAIYVPVLNILLVGTLSIAWGIGGYKFGSMFSENASYVIGVIFLLAGTGTHLAAIQWAKDISDTVSK